ncbi:MAG: hypothetical protein ACREYE_32240 [Gammaproteobacteria bacterium]
MTPITGAHWRWSSRATELCGEAPDAEIIGKLTVLTDLEPDD